MQTQTILHIPDRKFLAMMATIAGQHMRGNFPLPGMMTGDMKADKTLVTLVDRINNTTLHTHLAAYPGVALICEEDGKLPPRSEVEVIADELDGTDQYVCGSPECVFMAAVSVRGELHHSVMNQAILRRAFSASLGEGAQVIDGRSEAKCLLRVMPEFNLDNRPRVGVIGWKDCGSDMLAIWRVLEDAGCNVKGVGSIGLADALVASGAYAGVLFPGSSLHDTAPGDLLVREAGGVTSDFMGKSLRYDVPKLDGHIMACNGFVHDFLLNIVTKYRYG